MCGIVGGWYKSVEVGVSALLHRGPDAQGIIRLGTLSLGHTRLAILDLDARSNQPFVYGDTHLVFNGEIWNYKQLRDELRRDGCIFQTEGDTEVLAAALDRWGADALPRLNGMFAVAWAKDEDTLYLARDRFGEIPLHIAKQKPFCFASELKALRAMGCHPESFADCDPGHLITVTRTGLVSRPYYEIPTKAKDITLDDAATNLFGLLDMATSERTISDVPVCTLLSGGIDSAAVAYTLAQKIPNIVAYTAVYNQKSADLSSARLVADMLGIRLIEVKVAVPSPADLAKVIGCIEMPYKAQVEIGWPCLKLAEAMRSDGFKVTFSGEGSDELWASYGFAYHALQTQDWHKYRKELFLSQARKNFPRCNKIFMAHSIECRLPFLNPSLVEFAISLPKTAVQDGKSKPKAVIQRAYRTKLPPRITERAKVAFQDGMGIKDAIAKVISNPVRYYNAEYNNQYA